MKKTILSTIVLFFLATNNICGQININYFANTNISLTNSSNYFPSKNNYLIFENNEVQLKLKRNIIYLYWNNKITDSIKAENHNITNSNINIAEFDESLYDAENNLIYFKVISNYKNKPNTKKNITDLYQIDLKNKKIELIFSDFKADRFKGDPSIYFGIYKGLLLWIDSTHSNKLYLMNPKTKTKKIIYSDNSNDEITIEVKAELYKDNLIILNIFYGDLYDGPISKYYLLNTVTNQIKDITKCFYKIENGRIIQVNTITNCPEIKELFIPSEFYSNNAQYTSFQIYNHKIINYLYSSGSKIFPIRADYYYEESYLLMNHSFKIPEENIAKMYQFDLIILKSNIYNKYNSVNGHKINEKSEIYKRIDSSNMQNLALINKYIVKVNLSQYSQQDINIANKIIDYIDTLSQSIYANNDELYNKTFKNLKNLVSSDFKTVANNKELVHQSFLQRALDIQSQDLPIEPIRLHYQSRNVVNSLYAIYGYKFSNQKWGNIFALFSWYKPTTKTPAIPSDVNSLIESMNRFYKEMTN